ncbi:MAG: hypothetical protein J7K75_04025 [Desulfuromonas sp.]|nr:hypothetical protein [Desulfuromonas sp.]
MRIITRQWPLRAGLFLLLLICSCGLSWGEVTPVPLDDADCIKCHRQPSLQIREHGGAHNTELGCLGCHEAHPPAGEAVIPECEQCHPADENTHFALSGCQDCHSPHAPVIPDFSELSDAKRACLSCHDSIATAMEQKPSLHAEQDCSECHQQHGTEPGQFLNCLECHEAHSPDMVYADCLGCHNPHQPTVYQWSDETPSKKCGACHTDQVDELANEGSAHASEIHCSECHSQHPPAESGVIPTCADCHDPSEHEHYKVENCTACHRPHAPLNINMDAVSPIKPVCTSCHEEPAKEMQHTPSAHAEMDCNECHQQHGEALSCLDCHDGHGDAMSYNDCLRCHQPHSPTRLQFAKSGVPTPLCGSCHDGQFEQLSTNTSRHAKLQCVFCHRRTHKVTLSCDNCHGEPHDSSIHQHFDDCGKCHKGPHNLRN